ncbi:hypothetical protein CBU02nite_23010 [Clostridium butyricum]|uniref:Uncharacterized protein n=1 Tax=Clostridium butyricum TaxID=1492 RepID=A0A512TNJ5_CLOBU|nr:hypothetical protein CBU02nite_23010 [Clostridium butyricum]
MIPLAQKVKKDLKVAHIPQMIKTQMVILLLQLTAITVILKHTIIALEDFHSGHSLVGAADLFTDHSILVLLQAQ